ncbi:apolipoprotein A-I-binding protein-like, partial [Planoprotostelium fungivorum]
GLVTQCKSLDIPFLEENPSVEDLDGKYDVILDAIFGFSFSGEVRAPFDKVIENLKKTKTSIASVDIPSGWDVEKGNTIGSFEPQLLISLTAPKICARQITSARHFVGGRFVPKSLADRYELNLPPYPSTDQCVEL